ncbi:NF-kappa-B inhibitor-interacting Ras-like protein 1 isoform X2 [Erythrolamprus reginae]|uniref:NF-kappa-B inhibitor-interacting Ras-like protein 1 isoform X2 n=1 Tax=Erythrolamprus reginae TaxID=121349 RepID=UPI00396C6B41
MGKGSKVLVCGMCSVGKTAILKQVIYGNHTIGEKCNRTMEDIFVALAETDQGLKQQLRLYDTQGLQEEDDFPKHYYSMVDGFVLVYAVNSLESFEKVNWLKKEVDKFRENKEQKQHQIFHQPLVNGLRKQGGGKGGGGGKRLARPPSPRHRGPLTSRTPGEAACNDRAGQAAGGP